LFCGDKFLSLHNVRSTILSPTLHACVQGHLTHQITRTECGTNYEDMSYTNLLYHIVFCTKYRKPTIPQSHEENLYRYIWGFIKNHKSVLYRINGMPDHIHIFVQLHADIAVSQFVKKLKNATNKWLKENVDSFPDFESWAVGYCALTYAYKDKDMIVNYIKNQKAHHKKEPTLDEVRRLLEEEGIDIDERYFGQDG